MSRNALVLIVALALAAPAIADPPTCLEQLGETVGLDEVAFASLLYRSDQPGRYVRAPTLATEVEISVRGTLAEARVRQRFTNPTAEWVEGVYVFPLPSEAAVHDMRLVIGERIIEGQIQEKAEARRTYEKAKSEGRKASLVEQERPNIFTTSVANVGPGETVAVEIAYQQTLRWDGGTFELRFPMVVGPRYIPGAENSEAPPGYGWSRATDRVPDADRITPPVQHPSAGPANPVRLRVSLDAGLPLASLVCPYHAVEIVRGAGEERVVTLDGGEVPADRDFVLRWTPEPGSAPRAAVFTEAWQGAVYVLAMVVPPASEHVAEARLPRETVLVIDTSGSMQGTSIVQARAALKDALDRLHPEDLFNVIRFDSRMERLFPESRPAMPAALDDARAWVDALGAGGGTEMRPALLAALAEGEVSAPVRQVVFITDGCVGNEDELFALIHANLGRTRLFTVGIGSAPNQHFMERAAALGRGTFTFIGSTAEVATTMEALFGKLENPVLADLELAWPDSGAEVWPQRLPDLYDGEPLVVAARLGTTAGELVLSGVRAAARWETRVPLAAADDRAGIHRLWARRKIADLEASRARGRDDAEVRAAVLEVALAHHLVSRVTSLVAVDVTPTRPSGEGLSSAAVPTNLPAGWKWESQWGAMPRTATSWRLHAMVALALAALAGLVALVTGRMGAA